MYIQSVLNGLTPFDFLPTTGVSASIIGATLDGESYQTACTCICGTFVLSDKEMYLTEC